MAFNQSTVRKILKFVLHTSYFILVVLVLSGCNVIGAGKLAALQVTSTPEASVFLDGKHLGKTPFFSDQLKEGEYTIKITVSEASFVEKIDLFAGTLTVVTRELSNNFLAQSGETIWLEKGQKGLLIISEPNDADITIDGVYIGKTPLKFDIKEGDHKVLLAREGYVEREFAIKSSPKYQLVANVTLASQAAKGNLTASASPLPQIEKVEILKTPQGFLRVRKEPSLNAPEVGRVSSGDQLEIVQETEDWVKIQFEGKFGWISAQFTRKL